MRALPVLLTVSMLAATPSPSLAFQGSSTAKADAPTPAGKWRMTLETPHGTMVIDFDLKLDKEKVTGSMTGEMIGTSGVSGTFADGKVAFTSDGTGGTSFNFTFKDKDTMTGNLSSQMGDMACSAVRVKASGA